MLIQHKAELGSMFVDKIQVFRGETKAELPCIVWRLSQPRAQGGGEERKDDSKHVLRERMLRARL
jgi:hypothetical protein